MIFILLFSRLTFCFASLFCNRQENLKLSLLIQAQCCLQWEDLLQACLLSQPSPGPQLGNWASGSQHRTQHAGVQGRARALSSSLQHPPSPSFPGTLLALAVCSPGSSGASQLMNYESSLGVPTGAYGSAEPPRAGDITKDFPPWDQCQFKNQKLYFVNYNLPCQWGAI